MNLALLIQVDLKLLELGSETYSAKRRFMFCPTVLCILSTLTAAGDHRGSPAGHGRL